MATRTQYNEFQVGPLLVSVRTDTWAPGELADGPVSGTSVAFRHAEGAGVCFLSYDAPGRAERFRLVDGLQLQMDMDPGPEALDWADALEQAARILRLHHSLVALDEGEPPCES